MTLDKVKKHIIKSRHTISGFFTLSAEEKLGEIKMKDRLIKKYETYVSNTQWHKANNSLEIFQIEQIDMRMYAYNEFLADLKSK